MLIEYLYSDSFNSSIIKEKFGNGTEINYDFTASDDSMLDFNKYVEVGNTEFATYGTYKYDENYNVIYKTNEFGTVNYVYDDKGQLIRVNDSIIGKSYTYEYDERGNITAKSEYEYSTDNLGSISNSIGYHYDTVWQDKLITVDNNDIVYDEIGNPTIYKGWDFKWEKGRQLKSASNNDYNIAYTYDNYGLRTSKNVNGDLTEFTYIDKKIVEQHNCINDLIFKYDAEDNIIGAKINGVDFYYIKSLQGDVDKIVDKDGNVVVEYNYDPWGEIISVTGELADIIGDINPIRYRGYYYDNETELYYLQSRYYDPNTCRFINADDFCLAECNLSIFAYCNNTPIRYIDNDGLFAWDPVIPPINSKGDYDYFQNVWIPAHPEYSFGSYARRLGYYESGNNYKVTNSYGYLGYWQLGTIALQDNGYKDSNGNWTSKAKNLGIYSNTDFLNNSTAQDKIFVEYCKKQWTYIKNYGLTSYIGKTCDGVNVTDSGLLASCHLIGAYGMNQVLVYGKDLSDAYGTKPRDYLSKVSGYNVTYIK